jgi:hypothetical protein
MIEQVGRAPTCPDVYYSFNMTIYLGPISFYRFWRAFTVEKHGLHSVKHIKNTRRRFESHEWFRASFECGASFECKESVPPTLLGIEAGWERVGECIDESAAKLSPILGISLPFEE